MSFLIVAQTRTCASAAKKYDLDKFWVSLMRKSCRIRFWTKGPEPWQRNL